MLDSSGFSDVLQCNQRPVFCRRACTSVSADINETTSVHAE